MEMGRDIDIDHVNMIIATMLEYAMREVKIKQMFKIAIWPVRVRRTCFFHFTFSWLPAEVSCIFLGALIFDNINFHCYFNY